MKIFLNLLVSIFVATATLIAQAGGGGYSGGTNAKYLDVQICGGEDLNQCHWIKIKNKFTGKDSSSEMESAPECWFFRGDTEMIPCDSNMQYEIPKVLQKINNILGPASNHPQDLP